MIDRETRGTWAIIGDGRGQRSHGGVYRGRSARRVRARRAAIPDTIPMTGEPIVFDQGATVIVPSYRRLPTVRRGVPALSLWSLPFSGFEGRRWSCGACTATASRRSRRFVGCAQCGEPIGGSATCVGAADERDVALRR